MTTRTFQRCGAAVGSQGTIRDSMAGSGFQPAAGSGAVARSQARTAKLVSGSSVPAAQRPTG